MRALIAAVLIGVGGCATSAAPADRARHVAATARDPAQASDALAAEMGALTQVCVRCHSIYLYEPADSD